MKRKTVFGLSFVFILAILGQTLVVHAAEPQKVTFSVNPWEDSVIHSEPIPEGYRGDAIEIHTASGVVVGGIEGLCGTEAYSVIIFLAANKREGKFILHIDTSEGRLDIDVKFVMKSSRGELRQTVGKWKVIGGTGIYSGATGGGKYDHQNLVYVGKIML